MWLTAFVVKSFAEAQPFIFIDPEDLTRSINWIKSRQLENGCFPQVYGQFLLFKTLHSVFDTGFLCMGFLNLEQRLLQCIKSLIQKSFLWDNYAGVSYALHYLHGKYIVHV